MTHAIGLNFHGIGEPERPLEPDEARYWISEAQFVDILDRVASRADPSAYVLTFDDGNVSDHNIALPALTARGLGATVFVLTGRIGAAGSLNRSQIRTLCEAGIKIGSHGILHRPWPQIDGPALHNELAGSRAALEELCDRPVTLAGIPFGRYNARTLRALRRAGYAAAYSSDGGTMSPTAFLRPRTSLRADMTSTEIDAVLAGYLTPLRRMRRKLGMLRRCHLPLD